MKWLCCFLLCLPLFALAVSSDGAKLRNVIVVIDPGHGGKDPGATGPKGTHEKNVVLKIARYLRADLNNVKGITSYLTRSGDYYIPLRGRLKIARKRKADVFISIHADAFSDRTAQGASVFALSERGASSEAARWIARRENSSEFMGNVDLEDKSYLLRSVLIDLAQTATINRSLKLGSDVLMQLRRVTSVHKNRVEQAPFVVLKSPDIPSILIETGFISNPRQERLLNNTWFQKQIAKSIYRGVLQYFYTYPPKNSWMWLRKYGTMICRVRKGDTLSRIAKKYKTTVAILKQINNLKSNNIYIKQKLVVPKS